MSRQIFIRPALLISTLAAMGLSGCGKLGNLDQPAPMFGERAKVSYDEQQAQRRQDAADRAVHREGNSTAEADKPDNAPLTTRDIKAPEQRTVPASRAPIDGVPNPLGNSVSPNAPG